MSSISVAALNVDNKTCYPIKIDVDYVNGELNLVILDDNQEVDELELLVNLRVEFTSSQTS